MTENDLATLHAMLAHVSTLDEDLRPSKLWMEYNASNEASLRRHGIENFKRTLNQNYYNWVPWAETDNQLRNVQAYWDAHPDPAALQVEIDDSELLQVCFSTINPFSDPVHRARYARFVGLLWHHVRSSEPNGLLDRLAEPELGNPIRTQLQGRLISQDLANSVRERNTIMRGYAAPAGGRAPVIGELGAGYGRVAYVMLATQPVRYVIIDLPVALFVSQWYLTRMFPERRIFKFRPFDDFADVRDELAAADLAFLTPDQFYLLPDGYFDVFLTISSLAEMTAAQISQYIGLMCCKTKSRIYIKQWRHWTNTSDLMTVAQPDFDLQPGWRKSIDRVDNVQDLFFETLWEPE